jgi:hypothetical protein
MEDWRYEGLRKDIQRIEKELRKTDDRTFEVQQWQRLLPMRITGAIFWLIAACLALLPCVLALVRSN